MSGRTIAPRPRDRSRKTQVPTSQGAAWWDCWFSVAAEQERLLGMRRAVDDCRLTSLSGRIVQGWPVSHSHKAPPLQSRLFNNASTRLQQERERDSTRYEEDSCSGLANRLPCLTSLAYCVACSSESRVVLAILVLAGRLNSWTPGLLIAL